MGEERTRSVSTNKLKIPQAVFIRRLRGAVGRTHMGECGSYTYIQHTGSIGPDRVIALYAI